ncbi:hypothetical protein FOZ63_012520 [Perkinsus olseni]|uniref:Uncharacterized protein n=1 Tax=Perkinsus olseni TaxID=32597 RepID=A0A7J6U9T1_PEROL|nr:hypothetical protein FOZ63_012520 [Perkinsus olseni]
MSPLCISSLFNLLLLLSSTTVTAVRRYTRVLKEDSVIARAAIELADGSVDVGSEARFNLTTGRDAIEAGVECVSPWMKLTAFGQTNTRGQHLLPVLKFVPQPDSAVDFYKFSDKLANVTGFAAKFTAKLVRGDPDEACLSVGGELKVPYHTFGEEGKTVPGERPVTSLVLHIPVKDKDVWRGAVGPTNEEVIDAVKQSVADQRIFSMSSKLRSMLGQSLREDLGKEREVLRLCGIQLAHIWTMISEMLQSELKDGLAPRIMTSYLTFSVDLSRVETVVAEVLTGYVSLCREANLSYVVSMLGGGFRILSNFVLLTRAISTAAEYLKRQIAEADDDGVEEMQEDGSSTGLLRYDYLQPFLCQTRSLLLEAIGGHCELLEGIMRHHQTPAALPGLTQEIIGVRLNATSAHLSTRPLTHDELELWLDASNAMRKGMLFDGFRGSRSESFPEFRLRQQTSWRLLRESVGDSDYRRRQAAWGKSLRCLAKEFEGKSILRNSSVEKLPVAPVGGFSRMPTATSLSPTVEGEAQQQGHKKARREAITPSLEPPVGGPEAGHYASQSISSMLAESPREGGSLQVLARLQLKASAKTREACTAKMCERRPDTQKAEKMVRKKMLEEGKGLDFIFSRNRDRVLAAARPFTTSFALNQKQRRRVEAQGMSLTAPGGWPSMSDGGVNEQPGGVKKEKFIVKINKRDKWQRDVLWRKIFAHIDEATSAAAEPSASTNHLPAAHAVHRDEFRLPRHSAESLAALRQLPRSRSLLPPRARARVEDDEKWQAMRMLYYGGLDGDVAEHLDVIRECQLGLQDGKGSILERLEIYPMLQVPAERQSTAIGMLLQSDSLEAVHAL